jgi:hypothetical protein
LCGERLYSSRVIVHRRNLWAASGLRLGLAVLLLAILARIAVPSGWMPAGDGRHLMPCPGMAMPMPAPMAMHHAPSGHHRDSAPAQSHGEVCAFAAFAVPLLAPDDPWTAPALILAASWIATGFAVRLIPGHALAAPPPPATGPPPAF